MKKYEEIYKDLCARYTDEEVQNFFDTHERRVRDRVALEVVRAVRPDARLVTVPSSGGEREATLHEVESALRERAASGASYTPPKGGTTSRAVFTAAADLVKALQRGE